MKFWKFASDQWEDEEVDLSSVSGKELHRLAEKAADAFVFQETV